MTLGRFGPQGLTYPDGKPARDQDVLICLPGTTDAVPLYSDTEGTSRPNPARTDSLGNLWFYAEAGAYDMAINDAVTSIVIDPLATAGTPGNPGKSAYELALENGFSGSLSQWLDSLKAPAAPPTTSPDGGTVVLPTALPSKKELLNYYLSGRALSGEEGFVGASVGSGVQYGGRGWVPSGDNGFGGTNGVASTKRLMARVSLHLSVTYWAAEASDTAADAVVFNWRPDGNQAVSLAVPKASLATGVEFRGEPVSMVIEYGSVTTVDITGLNPQPHVEVDFQVTAIVEPLIEYPKPDWAPPDAPAAAWSDYDSDYSEYLSPIYQVTSDTTLVTGVQLNGDGTIDGINWWSDPATELDFNNTTGASDFFDFEWIYRWNSGDPVYFRIYTSDPSADLGQVLANIFPPGTLNYAQTP